MDERRGRYGSRVTVPTTLVAPGPGRFAFAFTVGLVVAATQKEEPSLMAFGTPTLSPPAGTPTSRINCTRVPARTQVPGDGHVAALEQPRPSLAPPEQ